MIFELQIVLIVSLIIFLITSSTALFGLKKFKENVHLIKGNSNVVLKKIDMSKINYVF